MAVKEERIGKKVDIYHFFDRRYWTKASAIAVLTADTV